MANNLVYKTDLDSSGVEQGAKQCEKSLGQIRRQAELAAKGLKSLSNDNGLNAVKEQFTSLGKQIDKFSVRMTSGLGIKQQSRLISAQLAEVANVYRSMSNEEKASTAGQYLKQYMQELTVLGGKATDTVKDMQAQIDAMSSDAPILAGLAEGVGLVSNAFTLAKGAASAFGMDEKKLADLQKQLTSLMAISNAAMQIKNALVNQGALKTAILNIQMKANILMTELHTAAAAKNTVASKAAAVAQGIWNKVIAANPMLIFITTVTAAALAIYELVSATKEEEREAKLAQERQEELNEVMKTNRENTYQSIAAIINYTAKVKTFNGTAEQENKLVGELNQKYGESLGQHDKLAQWKSVLMQKGAALAQVMILEAQAQGLLTKYTEHYINVLSARKALEALHITPELASQMGGSIGILGDYYKNEKASADLLLKEYTNVFMRAEAISKKFGLNVGVPSTTKSTSSKAERKETPKKQVPEGSLAYIDKEINDLEDKLKNAVDSGVYQQIKNDIIKLKNEKFFLTVELSLGKEEADRLFQQLSQPSNVSSIAGNPLSVPNITTSNPLASLNDRHIAEGIRQAQEEADKLLKSTEGLRMGAESAASAFSALGNAIGGSAGKAIDVAGVMAGAIATMIEAYATAIAGAAKLGPWAWVAFGLTGLAQLAGMIATVKQLGSYDTGGIVAGNGSFYAHNDGIILRAHQGEMMLNKQQQRTLFDRINNGFDTTNGKVEFFISGRNLKGVLNNYNDKLGRL